jgi:regulator of sirC expression with transglutaminase-like and TPR domain
MTEPDILSLKVVELKEWQRVAWRRVADRSVTDFERREIRNHIKESDEHLRYYLDLVSARRARWRMSAIASQRLIDGFLVFSSLSLISAFLRLQPIEPISQR